MNWEELLTKESDLFTLVGALAGQAIEQVAFKIAFAKTITPRIAPGSRMPWNEVLALLEDLGISLSESEARQLLLDSGLMQSVNGDLYAPKSISAGMVYPELKGSSTEVPIERFVSLLQPSQASRGAVENPASEYPSIVRCLLAVDRTLGWGLEVAATVRNTKLDGIPVFWDCDGDQHAPFTTDPGTLATADTLLLIVERARVGFRLPTLPPEKLDTAIWLWQRLLSLQRHDDAWNTGAFTVPAWDDDFVGSYLDANRDRGPCPTVDGTANAIVAVTAAVKSSLSSQLAPHSRESLMQVSVDAISKGLDFILRCQTRNGGWPIYRYEDDKFLLPDRDISSKFAVEALAEASLAGILPRALQSRASDAVARYLQWAESTVQREGNELSWVPNFTRPFARPDERAQATAATQLALDAIARAWPSLAKTIRETSEGTSTFIKRVWEPNPERFSRIAFRVPTWNGPAETRFTWELPADPMIVSMVLGSVEPAQFLDPSLCERTLSAIAAFLADEVHGHWVDFLMKREGKLRAMPGNTRHYLRALLDYLVWNDRLLEPGRG